MKDIMILKADKNDFADIQILFRKMFDIFSEDQDVEYPYTESGINYIKNKIDTGTAIVAKKEGKVVGFLAFSIQKALDFKTYDKCGFLENMYVLEEYRKNGIGKSLITEFLNICHNNNIKYVNADSDANQNLINFYTGIGFKITGVEYTFKL